MNPNYVWTSLFCRPTCVNRYALSVQNNAGPIESINLLQPALGTPHPTSLMQPLQFLPVDLYEVDSSETRISICTIKTSPLTHHQQCWCNITPTIYQLVHPLKLTNTSTSSSSPYSNHETTGPSAPSNANLGISRSTYMLHGPNIPPC